LLSLSLGALSLLLEPELIPVVVPDFALLVFIFSDFILEWVVGVAPGPTLPSLDAPGAGCICAEAIAVAPSIKATTRAEIASLDRMENLLLWMDDAGVKTFNWDLGSGPTAGFFGRARSRARGTGAGNALTDMKKDRHEKNAATWLAKQGPPYSPDQGIVRDKQGQEQPRDKARAQQADQMNSVRR
jgi:hypothetical protein